MQKYIEFNEHFQGIPSFTTHHHCIVIAKYHTTTTQSITQKASPLRPIQWGKKRILVKSFIRLLSNSYQLVVLLLVEDLLADGELVVGVLVEGSLELVEAVLADDTTYSTYLSHQRPIHPRPFQTILNKPFAH